MTRREMREHCFKILFGLDFYSKKEVPAQAGLYFDAPPEEETDGTGGSHIIHQVGSLSEEDRAFLTARAQDIAGRIPGLDRELEQVAEGWRIGRMGRVELTLLRQALYEMRWDDEVPEKVAINEAVELAKKYGGKDSPAFVNGILAKLVTEA